MEWYIYALGAIVLSSAFAIARKKALKNEHALEFESARSLAVVLLLLLILPFVTINAPWKIIALVYFSALLGAIGILLTAKAYRHSEISHIYPLGNLKVLIVLILAYLFLSERISPANVAGAFLLLFSAYALEADHHFSDLLYPIKNLFKSKYDMFFLSGILIFSITSMLEKYFVSNYFDPVSLLFLVWIFVSFNLNMIHGFIYGFEEVRKYFAQKPGFPFLVAFLSIGANFLYLTALQKAYVSLLTPFLMLSTLLVVLVGGKFFHEKNLLFRVVTSLTMLIGAYLVILQ
jgi:drug/metabolite transporter (DMT)-like permease